MGYFKHHAIVVTGDDYGERKSLATAHAKAVEIFAETKAHVTEITEAGVNGFRSFLVAPDGSKEGWQDSDDGDAARAAFIAYLRGDEAHWVNWAEISFGGDESEMIGIRSVAGHLRGWEGRNGEPESQYASEWEDPWEASDDA